MIIHARIKLNKYASKVIAADDGLIVELKAKPIDGIANAELLKTLSAHFKVPKTHIKILRGATSRYKTIEIPGIII